MGMRRALGQEMHAILFSLKRVYLGTLQVTWGMLAKAGLTPARFDLLYDLLRSGGMKWQSDIRRALGVCAMTVSRMVRSLEALGIVTRTRAERDRRQLEVRVTPLGKALVRYVRRRLIRRGVVDRLIDNWFLFDPKTKNRIGELEMFETTLHRTRRRLSDGATVFYPWHPDD